MGNTGCAAFKEAGYPPVAILVMFGLEPAAAAAIDLGMKRSIADLMPLCVWHPEMTSSMIATTRSWAENTGLGKIGTRQHAEDVCEWYTTIQPALEAVFAVPGVARGLPAPVIAAIVHRMHRSEDLRPLTFVERLDFRC